MSDLQQQYADCKKRLDELKAQIVEELSFPKGQLVRDVETGKHYRFDHVYVNSDGSGEIAVKEIRNHRVNWQSCSTPRFKSKSRLEAVEWEFDPDGREHELYQTIRNSDSVSEVESARKELVEMYLSCHHEWVFDYAGDRYDCKQCGISTISETQKDFLNGEVENQNIDLGDLAD